jgi:histidine phosphotransfer protein HptB
MKEVEMINWDRVASLRAEIGAADFLEVAELFLEEAEEAIARLRTGRPATGLEAELHFLKGSALNLGFDELAALCHDGEKQVASGATVDLGRVIQRYQASRAAFEAGLNTRMARAG